MRNKILGTALGVALALTGTAVLAARNSGGTYSLPAAYNPVVSGHTITSTWANTTLPDVATEITSSLDRSGRGGMLASLRLVDGLVGTPSLAFTSETTSGLYRAGAGDVRMSILGADVAKWTTAGFLVTGVFGVSDGAVGAPGLYFSADTDTGLYRIGANDAAFAAGGAKIQEWTAAGSAITGTLSASSTLASTGDFSVNTNKFNVTAASGNTTVAGTLGVTGDVAINTNKLTVTASNGNTNVAGTLNSAGQFTVATNKFSVTTSGAVTADSNIISNAAITATGNVSSNAALIGLGGLTVGGTGAVAVSKIIITTIAIDFPNIAASGTCNTQAYTVTGAALGGVCSVSPDAELGGGGHASVTVDCYVSTVPTVVVRLCNNTGGAWDQGNGNYRIVVFQP